MSLAELTQNCFQSGLSAPKWLGLSKLLVSKESTIQVSGTLESNLSNSVLVLFRGYPGHPVLEEYLQAALRDGFLSLPVFITTMLQAARSPDLHVSATITVLCRIALNAHYASGMPPLGSVVPVDAPIASILSTVQDAMALLTTAHTIAMSTDEAVTSASQLFILLLSCVSDISQVPTAQAMVYFADASDLMQNFQLQPQARQMLETFVLSLSLNIGDDAKAAKEAQIMHSLQMALGKAHIQGNSDTDDVTFGLFFHYLVTHRAHDFGAGDGQRYLALMVALFRWSSWSPTAFYTQMLLRALHCLVESVSDVEIWRAFILGTLLEMLPRFEKAMETDGITASEWRRALQAALSTCWKHSSGVVSQCDAALLRSSESSSNPDSESPPRSFSRDFVRRLIQINLIELPFATELDPLISSYKPHVLADDAQEMGMTLDNFLESKLSDLSDARVWVDRIWDDSSSHSAFASIINRRFRESAASLDAETLGHTCQLLYTYDRALDLVTLHAKLTGLISHSLALIERYDCDTVGDPQMAVTNLGHVVLFTQYTTMKYHLSKLTNADGQTISTDPINSTATKSASDKLSQEEAAAHRQWIKALFDTNTEGIEDNILRSIKPRALLRIASSVFMRALAAHLENKIDAETFANGVSYFTSPLLNWTLVGITKSLLGGMSTARQASVAAALYQQLSGLLLNPSCPRPVLCLSGLGTLRAVNEPTTRAQLGPNFDPTKLREVIAKRGLECDLSTLDTFLATTPPTPSCQHLIRNALSSARAGKPPVLDIDHCLSLTPPLQFLQLLWSELMIAASLGELESSRRIATFVLTMPRSWVNNPSGGSHPPLLPIFLHVVAPGLVKEMDKQVVQHQEHQNPQGPAPGPGQLPAQGGVQGVPGANQSQPPETELFVAIISSILSAALHNELAMHSVAGDTRFTLGQPSSSMARKFAQTLHAMARAKSPAAAAIAKRLAGSPTFIANFPVFMYD